jgi:hypothetical protein
LDYIATARDAPRKPGGAAIHAAHPKHDLRKKGLSKTFYS